MQIVVYIQDFELKYYSNRKWKKKSRILFSSSIDFVM